MPAFKMGAPVASINGVTANTTGVTVDVRSSGGATCYVRYSGTATVTIEACETDSATATDWATIATVSASGTGTTSVVVDEPHLYLRGKVASYASGTHYVKIAPWDGSR